MTKKDANADKIGIRNWRFKPFIALVTCMIILGSCSQSGMLEALGFRYSDPNETVGPDLLPALLPNFRAGDFYKFDDGAAYRVTSIDKNKVVWKIGTKFQFSTLRNIFYPWMSWESDSSRAYAETDGSEELWPLKVGNRARLEIKHFFFREKEGLPIEYVEEFTCSVLGTANITVSAGAFDTFKIRCLRHIERDFYVETIFYYYAPKVGYFVKTVKIKGPVITSTRQLASFEISLDSLSSEEQNSLRQMFQFALNNKASGEKTTWSSANGNQHSTVVPTKTFILANSQVCRNYTQNLVLDDREREFVGRACRGKNGIWKAP